MCFSARIPQQNMKEETQETCKIHASELTCLKCVCLPTTCKEESLLEGYEGRGILFWNISNTLCSKQASIGRGKKDLNYREEILAVGSQRECSKRSREMNTKICAWISSHSTRTKISRYFHVHLNFIK